MARPKPNIRALTKIVRPFVLNTGKADYESIRVELGSTFSRASYRRVMQNLARKKLVEKAGRRSWRYRAGAAAPQSWAESVAAEAPAKKSRKKRSASGNMPPAKKNLIISPVISHAVKIEALAKALGAGETADLLTEVGKELRHLERLYALFDEWSNSGMFV